MQMFKWVMLFLTLLFIYHVREVFPPFVVGGIIAYLLFPLVQFVNKRIFPGLSAGAAIGLIYILAAATLGIVIYKFGPTLAEQVTGLVEQRHTLATNLVKYTSDYFNLQLDVQQTSEQVLASIENAIGKPEEILHFGGMLSHGLLSVLVCIVSSIYFIVDSKRVGRFFLRFVPQSNKIMMVNMIGQMNLMLSKYVVGQVILIALMSAVAWTFLTAIFHLKYALVIAILAGFFEVIPVLGPFIAIAIAVVAGVSQYGVGVALPIVGCFLIARWLEDYLVVPAIIGHAVELHPLAVIFAVMVGETMAGALGMLIAIPVAASIKVIIDTFYPPEEHEVHHAPQPSAIAKMWNSFMHPGTVQSRKPPEEPPASTVPTEPVKLESKADEAPNLYYPAKHPAVVTPGKTTGPQVLAEKAAEDSKKAETKPQAVKSESSKPETKPVAVVPATEATDKTAVETKANGDGEASKETAPRDNVAIRKISPSTNSSSASSAADSTEPKNGDKPPSDKDK